MKTAVVACGLLLCTAAYAQPAPCATQESSIETELRLLATAKDDVGTFRTIAEQALTGARQCPSSARLWYVAARSAEVVEARMGAQAVAALGGLGPIVADALAHAPDSAAVLTVAARVDSDAALARKAFALDPAYAPARRALAEALAREGATEQALALVPAAAPRGPLHLARARILLAAGRHAEAEREARAVTPAIADELAPAADLWRDAQEVRGFALWGLNRRAEARRVWRAAAAAGSLAARDQLGR